MANFASNSDFSQSITEVFKKELKHAGYFVVDEMNHAEFELTGKIEEFYSKHDVITSSNIKIEITVHEGSTVIFQKVYNYRTSKFFVVDDPLPLSLSQILLELIKDLNTIFEGYGKCEMENFSVNSSGL